MKGSGACFLVPRVAQCVSGFLCDAYPDASSQQAGWRGGGSERHPPRQLDPSPARTGRAPGKHSPFALEVAGATYVDYMAAVDRQRALYNGARQWKE